MVNLGVGVGGVHPVNFESRGGCCGCTLKSVKDLRLDVGVYTRPYQMLEGAWVLGVTCQWWI